MEQSTFQGKLSKSATDAAAMEVHSKEEPPDFGERMIRVYKLDTEKLQQRVVFHILIADGCFFYGNDALRRRGGCCICLLMASGLTVKRFSIWVADAQEGEFSYTKYSKRFKLAVFIILPRLVYTMHPCVRPSKMDNNGGHENTKKDFLTYSVRHLSRLYVGKNNGQEVLWKLRPPNWPEHLSWKNPTSSPKDSTETLMEKYQYLRSQIPNEKFTREEQKAFQDFENGDIKNVKSFMCCNKWTCHMDDMNKELCCLQPSDLMLLQRKLTLLKNQVSSLLTASASSCPTAAATSSSSTVSRKRRNDSRTSVQSKRSKAEMLNTNILPKPSSQTACNAQSTIFVPITIESQSPSLESLLRSTACLNQTQSSFGILNSLMAKNCPDTSLCTTSSCHTEAAAAKNVQPSIPASSLVVLTNCNPLLGGSHEELQKGSLTPTELSVDSGSWSQEGNLAREFCDIELDKQKNDINVQTTLQLIHEMARYQNNNFDPSIFINFDA